MADFKPSKKTTQDFNNGVPYKDYDPTTGQNGDVVQAETLNNVIESQLWTQKLAENPVDNSQANMVGDAKLDIVYGEDGTPQLKAKYLKGVGISEIELVDTRVDGDNTINTLQIHYTNGEDDVVEIKAKNGALFEIPYSLARLPIGGGTSREQRREIATFIVDNIEKIKKGAYFVNGDEHNIIDYVRPRSSEIILGFNDGTRVSDDDYIQYMWLSINVAEKEITTSRTDLYVGDVGEYPQLLSVKYDGDNVDIIANLEAEASPDNEGKIIGIKNGQFVVMDAPSGGGGDIGDSITFSSSAMETTVDATGVKSTLKSDGSNLKMTAFGFSYINAEKEQIVFYPPIESGMLVTGNGAGGTAFDHHLVLKADNLRVYCTVRSNSVTPFTIDSLAVFLSNNLYNSENAAIEASGACSNGGYYRPMCIFSGDYWQVHIYCLNENTKAFEEVMATSVINDFVAIA